MSQARYSRIKAVKIDNPKIESLAIGIILGNLESSSNRISEKKLKRKSIGDLEKGLADEKIPLNTHHSDVVYTHYLEMLIREENIGYLVDKGEYFIVNRL